MSDSANHRHLGSIADSGSNTSAAKEFITKLSELSIFDIFLILICSFQGFILCVSFGTYIERIISSSNLTLGLKFVFLACARAVHKIVLLRQTAVLNVYLQ